MAMDTLFAQARRSKIGRSALDWIALLCLIAAGAFWFTLFWAVLVPPDRPLQQIVIALTMGMVYTLVLPLLWSILVPTTPAGMLLQKTQHATWGFAVVIGASVFLTAHGWTLLRIWWMAQPHVVAAGQDGYLSVACIIAFVLIPALAWTQVNPETWLAEIQQARDVTRLRHALAMEDAAMKAARLRALSIINAGLSNATIAERNELAGILGGFARAQAQAVESIAYTFKDLYGIEMKTAGENDAAITSRYKDVALLLSESADVLYATEADADDVAAQQPTRADVPTAAERDPHVTHRDVTPRVTHDPRSSATILDQDAYVTARRQLGAGAWMVKDLAVALRIEESTARKLKAEWESGGLITSAGMNGRFKFTERAEVAQ